MTETELAALRPALEAELARLRDTDVWQRIAAIEVLLGSTAGIERSGRARGTDHSGPSRPRHRGVNPHKLTAVREYVEAKGEVRQREITAGLEENSGAVSLALRALEEDGIVEHTGHVVNKSKVWRYIGPPARATVVEPGEGVRAGRKTGAGKS